MVIYDKRHETVGVSNIREAKVFAQESAEEEASCSSVANGETADVATVFGKMEIETDKKTENRA